MSVNDWLKWRQSFNEAAALPLRKPQLVRTAFPLLAALQ